MERRIPSPELPEKTFKVGDFVCLPNTHIGRVIEYRWVGNMSSLDQILNVREINSINVVEVLSSECILYEYNARELAFSMIKTYLNYQERYSNISSGIMKLTQSTPIFYDYSDHALKSFINDYNNDI